MNREIKFRAWDGKNMDYDPYQCTDGPEVTGLNTNIERMFQKAHNPQYLSLMQFTSLKDKNGKEIYEGDICQFIPEYGSTWTSEVIFERGCFKVDVTNGRTGTLYGEEEMADLVFHRLIKSLGSFNVEWYIEIIGNIYENPELNPIP